MSVTGELLVGLSNGVCGRVVTADPLAGNNNNKGWLLLCCADLKMVFCQEQQKNSFLVVVARLTVQCITRRNVGPQEMAASTHNAWS